MPRMVTKMSEYWRVAQPYHMILTFTSFRRPGLCCLRSFCKPYPFSIKWVCLCLFEMFLLLCINQCSDMQALLSAALLFTNLFWQWWQTAGYPGGFFLSLQQQFSNGTDSQHYHWKWNRLAVTDNDIDLVLRTVMYYSRIRNIRQTGILLARVCVCVCLYCFYSQELKKKTDDVELYCNYAIVNLQNYNTVIEIQKMFGMFGWT